MQATVYRQMYSLIMTMRMPALHHHIIISLIYTLYRLHPLVSTPASETQPGYRLLSSTISFPPRPLSTQSIQSSLHLRTTKIDSLQLRPLPDRPNLKPLTILLQHPLIMIFPELLRSVLPRDPLQNLSTTWMFVYKPYPASTLAFAP
jgi:hypothetical protein